MNTDNVISLKDHRKKPLDGMARIYMDVYLYWFNVSCLFLPKFK